MVPIGQQSYAHAALPLGELNGVPKQLGTDVGIAYIGRDNHVLKQCHSSPQRSRDGVEKVNHGLDLSILTGNQDMPNLRVANDLIKAAPLCLLIRRDFSLLREQNRRQLAERRNVR